MTAATVASWGIAALSIAGVIGRPWRLPEWIWAVAGAVLLVLAGLLPVGAAVTAIGRGMDIYLFLTGMMLLSETAREQGVFDWIAAVAVRHARGSPTRLFALVYAAGIVVTTFLSNDATAVVLTPAVFAAARKAKAEPLPLLLACALIANAASFVLPISNPANLVLYGGDTPALDAWLDSFLFASVASIVATFVVLRLAQRRWLTGRTETSIAVPALRRGGRAALAAIALTALLLLLASAFDLQLGLPTAIAGVAATLVIAAITWNSPIALARRVSWGVLLLVAGLFVLVAAIDQTGIATDIAGALRAFSQGAKGPAAAAAVVAAACNLMNNLPAGLMAATAIAQVHPPRAMVDALLIGVDLGPNLSVTGSLATILWLQVIRREEEDIGFWRFLKVGAVAMPAALAAALAARLLV